MGASLSPEALGLVIGILAFYPQEAPQSYGVSGLPHTTVIAASGEALRGKVHGLPIGSIGVPFGGSYIESCKVIPKRNYYGASGCSHSLHSVCVG